MPVKNLFGYQGNEYPAAVERGWYRGKLYRIIKQTTGTYMWVVYGYRPEWPTLHFAETSTQAVAEAMKCIDYYHKTRMESVVYAMMTHRL